jgi:hypothetical protein
MTVPRFLQSTFHFNQDVSIVDVATIITNLTAILTGQTPAWTNPSPGVLVSPVDSAGRFMTLTLTRVSAAVLEMAVKDQNGVTVSDRSFSLIAGPSATTINYFTGQYHCYLESLTGGSAVGEWIGAMMTDPTDYSLQDNQNYVMGGGTRNSGGANDGQCQYFDEWFMLESGAPTIRQRARLVTDSAGVNAGLIDFAGNLQFFPFDVLSIPNGKAIWAGSMYQVYVTDSSVGGGVIKPVAIDNSTPAQFRSTVVPASPQLGKMMIRVA